MSRVALIVGIDDYATSPLSGCVNDASHINSFLSSNEDRSPNFSCRLLVSSSQQVTRSVLRKNLQDLFSRDAEIALLFFAGHGYLNDLGGYLVTQDMQRYDEGISMSDVLALANRSRTSHTVIMLDCCHSGALGQLPVLSNEQVAMREGLTILCASRSTEAAVESNGSGLFTSLVCEALNGAAASLTGDVTVASLYSFVDANMGIWQQRPLFKANLSRLVSLRKCDPAIELTELRLLVKYFSDIDSVVSISLPAPDAEPDERIKYIHFRKYRLAALIKTPMHGAAMGGDAFLLTSLGRYYWQAAQQKRI